MDINLSKYIGHSYEKYDCFALVKEFYKDQFNLELGHLYTGPALPGKEASSLIQSNRGDFVEVKGERKFGDLILIRLYGLECHIGVFVKGSQFIHSAKHIGSCIDRVEKYSRLIAGFYRHREHIA